MVDLKKLTIQHIGWTSSVLITLLFIPISYFFLIPPSFLSKEYVRLSRQCNTCEDAQKLAVRNFTDHNYQIFNWGLLNEDSPSLKIANNLKGKFGITTIYGGCVSPPSLICYDRTMRQLLASRYELIFR